MSYLTPDLTGTNPDCRVVNHREVFITNFQKIEFHDSVFLETIDANIVVAAGLQKLIYGIDFVVNEDDKDTTATSRMKLLEPTFDKVLVKSITIVKPYVDVNLLFDFAYNKLYPIPSKYALTSTLSNPGYIDWTPEIAISVLETQARHEALLTPIKSVQAIVDKNPRLLEEDPNKEYPENLIMNEDYEINVPGDIYSIRPVCGAFFRDSLSVSLVSGSTTTPLKEGEDYEIYGIDIPRTRRTTNTSGVYRYIIFKKDLVATVRLTYHAFGGDPTLYDVKNLDETNNNIIKYITDSQLITAETLGNTPIFSQLVQNVLSLEEEVRRLANSGKPTYGDVSHGNSIMKKISAVDTEYHWWTIAELYKVQGSETVFISDIMKLNISTLNTKFTFSTEINVNLLNETSKFDVVVNSSLSPIGYVPFEDYSGLDNLIRPQFRIIWNDNTVEGSGIFLQLGFALKTVVEETIVIEDVSGQESCWKLISSSEETTLPEDTLLELPNTSHIWDISNPDSKQETFLIPLKSGNICWAGTEPLNRPTAGLRSIRLTHFLEQDIDIRRIKQIRYDLEEDGGKTFPVMINVIPGTESLLGTQSFMYNGSPAHFTASVTRDEITKEILFDVSAFIEAGLSSSTLNLRHVIIYT